MHNYVGMKLKRKDLDEVNGEFSEFSLSSPARKIRRLDAELPAIMEEAEFMVGYEHSTSEGEIEEFSLTHQNKEKAIVPFKPMDDVLIPSHRSYSIDPNLISFKNQAFYGSHLNPTGPSDVQEVNPCRAVILWVPPSQHHINQRPTVISSKPETMDSEEMDYAETMEMEESVVSDNINYPSMSQWQKQHCMVPQPPQNITTPIVWYRL